MDRLLDCVLSPSSGSLGTGYTVQALSNLCWALAVLNLQHHASTVLTLVQATQPLWADMTPKAQAQFYQAHIWLIDHGLAGRQGLAGVLTRQQLQQCRAAWEEMLGNPPSQGVGKLHQEVFRTLQSLHFTWLVPPALEQVSLGVDGQPDGAFRIDITAKTNDGVWLAVGRRPPWATHFRQPDQGLMGATQYRDRALVLRGYRLISVPYFEWDKIRHSDEQQQAYLRDKINRALAATSATHRQLQDEAACQEHRVPLEHGQFSSSKTRSLSHSNSTHIRKLESGTQ